MINFQGKIWHLTVSRNLSVFHSAMDAKVADSWGTYAPKKDNLYLIHNGRHASIFITKENVRRYEEVIERTVLTREGIRNLEQHYHIQGEQLYEVAKSLEFEYHSREIYQQFVEAYSNLTPGLFITTVIGRYVATLLDEELRKVYPEKPKEERERLMADLTYPDEHTPLTKSHVALLELGELLQENDIHPRDIAQHPEHHRAFREYARAYRVIPANFCEEPWTAEEITEQLCKLMDKNCAVERQAIIDQHLQRVERMKALHEQVNHERIQILSVALQIGTLLNEYRKHIFCHASVAHRPLLRAIARAYDLRQWRELWKLTPEEIEQLYFDRDTSQLNKLKEREWVGVICDYNHDQPQIIPQSDLTQFIDCMNQLAGSVGGGHMDAQETTIKGMIANPGIVQGVVKVILSSEDFNKFEDDDILVTTMTSVDFVPLMRRAAAFITNEGGITSHASIVSRELNKPCIIGTKNATSILTDGDVVEVNAEQGLVKIIKEVLIRTS